MLIGCCSNLVAQGDDKVGIGRFEAIKAAGFDYVELPIANVMELDDEAFEALCSKLEELDLKCLRCCNLFPASVRVTGEEADYTKVREYLDKAVARMRKLGAKVVVFGSSGARNVAEGYPFDLAMLQIVKTIYILDEYGDDDLHFVIEHICNLEGNIIKTLEDGCRVHDVCRTKHIDILADTYHMYIEGEPIENLLLAGSDLKHVHTANPVGRVYPKPDDGVDYKKMFDLLKSIGYDGGVSVEGYSDNFEEDAKVAVETLRKAMA